MESEGRQQEFSLHRPAKISRTVSASNHRFDVWVPITQGPSQVPTRSAPPRATARSNPLALHPEPFTFCLYDRPSGQNLGSLSYAFRGGVDPDHTPAFPQAMAHEVDGGQPPKEALAYRSPDVWAGRAPPCSCSQHPRRISASPARIRLVLLASRSADGSSAVGGAVLGASKPRDGACSHLPSIALRARSKSQSPEAGGPQGSGRIRDSAQ